MEYYPRKIDENLEKWVKRKEAILIKGHCISYNSIII